MEERLRLTPNYTKDLPRQTEHKTAAQTRLESEAFAWIIVAFFAFILGLVIGIQI